MTEPAAQTKVFQLENPRTGAIRNITGTHFEITGQGLIIFNGPNPVFSDPSNSYTVADTSAHTE